MGLKPIRMLLIGAGFMGRIHLDAARKLAPVKYVGVVDVNERLARKLAASFGLKAYTDPETAIDATRPDAVDLCVPTPWHRPMVAICAARGVHVLCEKPIALARSDALAIKTLAAKTGIRIMIAHVLRFWPEYAFTAAAARQGRFGKIRAVECRRLSPPPGWNSWMMRPGLGDGAVVDLQIHDMDFIVQLLGKPAAVRADGVQQGGAFNSVANRLYYPSGAVVLVKASFMMPASYPFRMAFLVEFEKGVIDLDSWRPKGEQLRIYPARGKAICPKLEQGNAYGAEIDYFVRRLRDGKPFSRVPLDESIAALDLCLASKRSCVTGRSVCLK
ncbi:MAG: Gfo/Idh/MocA family oxidoreductase [Kiritimatiellia bacterium]|nr:Gfo/Idh/MocA family oxidoreductase [Kiritimatiellia bacterium]